MSATSSMSVKSQPGSSYPESAMFVAMRRSEAVAMIGDGSAKFECPCSAVEEAGVSEFRGVPPSSPNSGNLKEVWKVWRRGDGVRGTLFVWAITVTGISGGHQMRHEIIKI